MHRLASFLTLVLMIFISGTIAIHAESSKTDERLQKSVTYEGGYQRLRNITDDLSTATGVKILCGKTPEDWRIRDIPVIVYARDIPLLKLLQSISEATHCQLAEVKLGDDKPKAYRIYRTRKMEAEIEGKANAVEDAKTALISWAWDVLVEVSKRPIGSIKLPAPATELPEWQQKRIGAIDVDQIKLVGELLASLGSNGKEKVLSGEQILERVGTAPETDVKKRLFRYAARHIEAQLAMEGGRQVEVTDEDLAQAAIDIEASKNPSDVDGVFSFAVVGMPYVVEIEGREERIPGLWTTNPIELARILASIKELNLPPMPNVQSAFDEQNDPSVLAIKPIEAEEDWNSPFLQTKTTIEVPKNATRPTRQEILASLSKNLGLTIVCEDFISHKDPALVSIGCNFGAETTIADVLRRLGSYNIDTLKWSVDENAKLLVGSQPDWRKCHRNLVPSATLEKIQEKRATTGAELDDLAPILQFTRDQFEDWISSTAQFPGMQYYMDSKSRAIFQLYDAIGDSEKARAKSGEGLPLFIVDPAWASSFCTQAIANAKEGVIDLSEDTPEQKEQLEALTNPEILKNLTMRVTKEPLRHWYVWERSDGLRDPFTPDPVKGPKKHTYTIKLDGKNGDKEIHISGSWYDVPFPLFTIEKERQLVGAKPK